MDNALKYFMALDAGTSSVKAALFDGSGRQIAVDSKEYELEKPAPETVEVDPEVYWMAAEKAIKSVIEKSEVSPQDILSIGVTSQGETLITLDQEGKPLRKAIVWLDNRAVSEAKEISANFAVNEVYKITGQQEIVPGWTASKILWIRNNEPEVFKKAAKFVMVADYLIYKLTGNFISDHALNPSTLYYNLKTGDWWDEMLDFLNIRRDQLPKLYFSGHSAGTVNANIGLSPKTTVVTAPIDQIAGAVGAGNLGPGMITETTGSALAICAACPAPVYDPQKRVGLYRHATQEDYVLLPWVPVAGMIFRWFRDEFGGCKSYLELEQEAENIEPGANGLLLIPHLAGAFSPEINPDAKGIFYGFSLGHTRGHFVMSLFESVAFMLRENIEMLEELEVPVDKICSLGGGAQSDFWMQLKANVLNRELLTVETKEATCLGTAVLAAVGARYYESVQEAVSKMIKFEKSFTPEKSAAEKYNTIYKKYIDLNKKLLPTFGGYDG